jgi:hypothetical protein
MSFSTGGFNRFEQRLKLNSLAGVALRNFFSQYGQAVVTEAKTIAPRFEGNLRGSLTFKHAGIDATGIPIGIDVFSRSKYALYVHGFYDQKFKMKEPWSRSKPHYPPIKSIEKWSRAKGISPYAVQQAIGRKGTPIIPFFKIAIKNNEALKNVLLKKTGVQIQAKWTAGRLIR